MKNEDQDKIYLNSIHTPYSIHMYRVLPLQKDGVCNPQNEEDIIFMNEEDDVFANEEDNIFMNEEDNIFMNEKFKIFMNEEDNIFMNK